MRTSEKKRPNKNWTDSEEKTIGQMLGSGHTVEDIAERLERSPGSVKSHMRNIDLLTLDGEWIRELEKKGVTICPRIIARGTLLRAGVKDLVELTLKAHEGDCQFSHDCPERRPECQRIPIPHCDLTKPQQLKFEETYSKQKCDINLDEFYY